MAEGRDTNASFDIEYTEWVKQANLPEKISHFVGDRDVTAIMAKGHVDIPKEMLFWTDRSRFDSKRIGASVTWRQTEWET